MQIDGREGPVLLTEVDKRQSSSVDGIFGRVGILRDNRRTITFVVGGDRPLDFLTAQIPRDRECISPLAVTRSWILADVLGDVSMQLMLSCKPCLRKETNTISLT